MVNRTYFSMNEDLLDHIAEWHPNALVAWDRDVANVYHLNEGEPWRAFHWKEVLSNLRLHNRPDGGLGRVLFFYQAIDIDLIHDLGDPLEVKWLVIDYSQTVTHPK